jgi:tripartite-type tricarboxylate transporter receptor subunit TctC
MKSRLAEFLSNLNVFIKRRRGTIMKKKVLYLIAILIILMIANCGCSSTTTAAPSASQAPAVQSSQVPSSAPAPQASAVSEISYPKNPVETIVAWSAGSTNDIRARILSEGFAKYAGKPNPIVNLPGAGAELGFTELANAKPDGYTIGVISSPNVVLIPLDRDAGYGLDSFEYIIACTVEPRLCVVASNSPFKSFNELVDYAKANPDDLSFGHGGAGTAAQYCGLDLQLKAGVSVLDVPFGGSGETQVALMGNHIDFAMLSVGETVPRVEAGDMRVLAVFDDERAPEFPDSPTAKECGIDMVHITVFGFGAPKGTPPEIINYIHDTFKKSLEDPEVAKKLADAGYTPRYLNGEQFKSSIQVASKTYQPVVEMVKEALK